MASKMIVSSFDQGKWVIIGGYNSMSEIYQRFPNIRCASGPDKVLYAIDPNVGNCPLIKIETLKSRFLVFNRDGFAPSRRERMDADTLEQAKNNIPGKTIWFEQNKAQLSYGLGEDGKVWMIEETFVGNVYT